MLIISAAFVFLCDIVIKFTATVLHVEYDNNILNCICYPHIIDSICSHITFVHPVSREFQSRKSTHKRQKQYFEQRKQQRRRTAGSEGCADETSIAGQHQKECRSLDILSLLNLSTVPDKGRHGKIDASTMKYHIPKDPTTIITNSVPPYSVKVKEAGAPPSSYQGELEYPKVLFCSHDNRDLNGGNNNPDLWNAATENQLSVLDMLSDDASEGSSERSLVHEAHVAFSIEGLGKIRTETPLHSPKQEGRISSDDCLLPWNIARQLNSSRSSNYVLNDLELEVEAMMQDINIPLGGDPSEFSMDITDSHDNWKPKLSTFADHMQLDSHYRNRKCSFGDTGVFDNIRREDIWDARVSFLDDDFLHEREDDVSWKCWPQKIDGDSGDFLDYEMGDMSENAFEGHNMLRKRDVKATKLNSLEPPSPKHTSSEVGHVLTTLIGVRHTPIQRNYEDLPGQPDWHLFETEDTKDNLSLLSEESCSSSAVRGETIKSSLPSLMPRQSRSGNTFGRTRMKYNVETVFAEERHCKDRANLRQRSGKYTRTPVLPRSKATKPASSCFQGEIGPSQTWLREEGCNSFDIDLGFSSSHCTSEANLPGVGSRLWAEDPIGAFPVPELDVKSCFNGPTHGESIQCFPFGCFASEKFAFCQPFNHNNSYDSPVFLNVGPGSVMRDLSPDSKMRGVPLDSSSTAGLHSGFPDLSVQGSISGNYKIKSKLRPANSERFEFEMDGWNPNNKDLERKEAKDGTLKPMKTLKTIYSPEHGVETSSSVTIHEKCERERCNCDVEIPVPCQSETEEPIAGTENAEFDFEEGKAICRGENSGEDPSKQVVEFVCVEKVGKETSVSASALPWTSPSSS